MSNARVLVEAKEVRLFYFYFMHATTYDSDSASGLVSVKEVVSLI